MPNPLTGASSPQSITGIQPPIPKLIRGFELSQDGSSAIKHFVTEDERKFKLTVPISNQANAESILKHYDDNKMASLTTLTLAAGIGTTAVSLSFKHNEQGHLANVVRHLKKGNAETLDEEYFNKKEVEIDKSSPEWQNLQRLKSSIENMGLIFGNKAFKGASKAHKKQTESEPMHEHVELVSSDKIHATPLNTSEDSRMAVRNSLVIVSFQSLSIFG